MSRKMLGIGALLLLLLLSAMPLAAAAGIGEKRQEIRNMADETLGRLYRIHPEAKDAVESAFGYAVFSNYGIKLFVLGGGRGKGVAVGRSDGREVFMKKAEIGLGLGLGLKNYSEIFVFETKRAFDKFINQGWELSAQTTLAATDGVSGGAFQGAVSIWPDAWLYQMTDKGLAIEITGQGNRYFKDSELN